MTWLQTMRASSEPQFNGLESREAMLAGLGQLGIRVGVAFLLVLIVYNLLPHLPYYREPWRSFFPLLVFVVTLLSIRTAVVLAAVLIGLAVLHATFDISPGAVVWYAFFLLLLFGIYEDRPEHAVLVASPIVLLPLGYGFLPILLIGMYFQARGGLVNGIACVPAIAFAIAAGQASFGDFVVTGLEEPPPASLFGQGQPAEAASLIDFSWLENVAFSGTGEGDGSLGVAESAAKLGVRWANTVARSPAALAQFILWGVVAIATYQSTQAGRFLLSLSRWSIPEWFSGFLARAAAVLVGATLFGLGYSALGGTLPGVESPTLGDASGFVDGAAVWASVWKSAFTALVLLIVVDAYRMVQQDQMQLGFIGRLLVILSQWVYARGRAVRRRQPALSQDSSDK